MAADPTERYEIYGIVSAELGVFGMLLNDRIGGQDNWNVVYEPWIASGMPEDQPQLVYEEGELLFSYVYGQDEEGASLVSRKIVDCGYDTGHMELRSASGES